VQHFEFAGAEPVQAAAGRRGAHRGVYDGGIDDRLACGDPVQRADELIGSQHDTDQFIGVIAGTVPIPEFFAHGNIQRIIDTSRKPAAHGHQAAGSSISPSPPATGAVPPPS
jgi:hypothetical protein